MEIIDYFNEGILGALQAQLRPRANNKAAAANEPEKYHKLSVVLSNACAIVPRNARSPVYLIADLKKVKVSNTVQSRRIILGIDVRGGRIGSSQLNPDGSYSHAAVSPTSPPTINESPAPSSSPSPPPSRVPLPSPHQDLPQLQRAPVLELDFFTTCILPQPENMKQPMNEKYFDSITEVEATTCKGTISWAQYVLILNLWNENIRAQPPIRPKVLVKPPSQLQLQQQQSSSSSSLSAEDQQAPSSSGSPLPAGSPSAPSSRFAPSVTDAPAVIYHINDERRWPLTLDIRVHIALAQIKFLLGNGYVTTGSINQMNQPVYREDPLTELNIVETEYIFHKYSSNHMHQQARIHSITCIDIRDISKLIPFKKMLCPFSQIRENNYFKNIHIGSGFSPSTRYNSPSVSSSSPSAQPHRRPSTSSSASPATVVAAAAIQLQQSGTASPSQSVGSGGGTASPLILGGGNSVSPVSPLIQPATSSNAATNSMVPPQSIQSESEVVYIQHDWPTGERDMQLNIYKPCGFVVPDFWGDLLSFLFSANDSAFADVAAINQEWNRKYQLIHGQDSASAANSNANNNTSQSPSPPPRADMNVSTTGSTIAGYHPTVPNFKSISSQLSESSSSSASSSNIISNRPSNRPFRCFKLDLKNCRSLLLEDLTQRSSRALIAMCDATMIYISEEINDKPVPSNLQYNKPTDWWTYFVWNRYIKMKNLRCFIVSSATNPIINISHSVITPINLIIQQENKVDKRFCDMRRGAHADFDMDDDDHASTRSNTGSQNISRSNSSSSISSQVSSASSSAGSPPTLRLEVQNQVSIDMYLSSASGIAEEPIELRASYLDFKLLTRSLESLKAQQERKMKEQERAQTQQQKQQQQESNQSNEPSSNSLNDPVSTLSAPQPDTRTTPHSHKSSAGSMTSRNNRDSDDEDVDQLEFDDEEREAPSPIPSPSPFVTNPQLHQPPPQQQLYEIFNESVQMFRVVWQNQLTLVVINDCFQRYVPLVHFRVLPGDALYVAKKKELDDVELIEAEEEAELEEREEEMKIEEEEEAEGEDGAVKVNVSKKKQQTPLERARLFLSKLKSEQNKEKAEEEEKSVVSAPSSSPSHRRLYMKKIIDYKTVAFSLLLELTFFNPRVVAWEPLIEPFQLDIKLQYETPNIKSRNMDRHHHSESFGTVMGGKGQRRTGGALAANADEDVAAWSININCQSRINLNISYVFLQHLWTTLQSWTEDSSNHQTNNANSGVAAGLLASDSSSDGKSNSSSSFAPYFIRNLTGAQLQYKCRSLIKNEDKNGGGRGRSGSRSYNVPSYMGSSNSSSSSSSLQNKLLFHSEFAANPSSFISPFIPASKRRYQHQPSQDGDSASNDGQTAWSDEEDEDGGHHNEAADNAIQEGSDEDNAGAEEQFHALEPGCEEQLSLRLISGLAKSQQRHHHAFKKLNDLDSVDTSAADDVYRSILESRTPFTLRVKLAGGWVSLHDLVVNKTGTTSYVLQLDNSASAVNTTRPAQRKPSLSSTTTPVLSPLSTLSPSNNSSSTKPGAMSAPSPTTQLGSLTTTINDYFSNDDNSSLAVSTSLPPQRSTLGLNLALAAGNATGGAAAVSMTGALMSSPPNTAAQQSRGNFSSSSGALAAPTPLTSSVHSVGSSPPGMPVIASPATTMVQINQLSDRKRLLFVDVVLRDGSKLVTLRSPIELVNRTNKHLCFLLHAHPTTSRRLQLQLESYLSSHGPFPSWQDSNSPFLQTKDAYAILGPVAPNQSINVPFSLTHLDFVSVLPVSQKMINAHHHYSHNKKQHHTSPSMMSGLSAVNSVSSSLQSVLTGLAVASSSTTSPSSSTSSSHTSPSFSSAHSDDANESSWDWSDTALSQSSLMKLVHKQATGFTAAAKYTDKLAPGIVVKLQCQRSQQQQQQNMQSQLDRLRADSLFLFHVQAIHGSASAPLRTTGSVGRGMMGENLLTMSLVFTSPLILRNLFPFGIDFRVAYTRSVNATALTAQQRPQGEEGGQNVMGVDSQTKKVLQAKEQSGKSSNAEMEKKKKEKEKLDKKEKEANKAAIKTMAKSPSSNSLASAPANTKSKWELWGHLSSGQHLYFPHLNLDRDPYLLFRLDGFGWCEPIPLQHLNPHTDQNGHFVDIDHNVPGSTHQYSTTGGQTQIHHPHGDSAPFDYTISSFQMRQCISRHHVSIEDANNNPLIALLESRRAGPMGGGIELDVYAQYWLVNRTGLDLLYGSRLQTTESSASFTPPRTLPGHGGRVEVCTYENQRYRMLDGWVEPFLPTDRPAWSDEGGTRRSKEDCRLPADDGSWQWEGDWKIDFGNKQNDTGVSGSNQAVAVDSPSSPASPNTNTSPPPQSTTVAAPLTDGNGWQYAVDFPWAFHNKNNTLDAVRRRKWIRTYVSTRSLKSLCLHSTNIKGFHEELCIRIASTTHGNDNYVKEQHTKSGPNPPLLRVRQSESLWVPFTASSNSDGVLLVNENQAIDVSHDSDMEAARWKRAASHVMALADSGMEKGKFQLHGDDKELGSLVPHVQPRGSYHRQNRYDVGVSFAQCPGLFYRSQLITFTPRFVLVNELPYTLSFRQAGAFHRVRVPVLQIESGKFQPLWWVDVGVQELGSEALITGPVAPPPNADPKSGAAKVLSTQPAPSKPSSSSSSSTTTREEFEARARHRSSQNKEFEPLGSVAFNTVAGVRWRWSGAFPLSEVGELSIACRSSAQTSRYLRIKIQFDGATVFVVFREENARKPRYRLDNNTNTPCWYRQKLANINDSIETMLVNLPVPYQSTSTGAELQPQQQQLPQQPPNDSPAAPFVSAPPPASFPPSSPPAGPQSINPNAPVFLPPGANTNNPNKQQQMDTRCPWLYLGPHQSTPFAWQEVMESKPYLLEVITTTPYIAPPPSSYSYSPPSVAMHHPAASSSSSSSQYSHHPSSAFSTSFPATSLAAREARERQEREREEIHRLEFESKIRSRLGHYSFHLCDHVQLDEIGYSVIHKGTNTYIDVFVEDEVEYDKDKTQQPSQRKNSDAGAGAGAAPNSKLSLGSTTKVMKLVRVRNVGLVEAAAIDSSQSDYIPVHRRELQVEKTSLYFEFTMPKLGLSLVDHMPRELCLFSVRDFRVTYSKSNIYEKLETIVGDIQIDNQLNDAMFPVVLHQKIDLSRKAGQTHVTDRKSSSAAASSAAAASQRVARPRPFLHMSCIRLTKYSSLEHYKYFGFIAQEFILKLDQSFILACIPFLDVFQSDRYTQQYKLANDASHTESCCSTEDLERELGLPLISEEEYSHGGNNQQASTSQQANSKATLSNLETELQVQMSQLSHLKAVLATLTSKLGYELNKQKEQAAAAAPSEAHLHKPNTLSLSQQEAANSIRILQEEIARTKQQYQRILDANQSTALQIHTTQQQQQQQQASQPAPPPQHSLAPAHPPLQPPRSSQVSSVSPSYLEGVDIRREEVRTRYGNVESKGRKLYRGWIAPWGRDESNAISVLLTAAAPSSSAQQPARPAATSTATQAAATATSSSSSSSTSDLVATWLIANSGPNSAQTSRTLTSLVNSVLSRSHHPHSHARGGKNKDTARKHNKKKLSHAKHTEEDTDVEKVYYLETVEIQPLQFVFSFFTLPSSRGTVLVDGLESAPELLSPQTQQLANAVSSKVLMIANAEDAHLRLVGVRIIHSFTTLGDAVSLLSQHYHRQLNNQLFEIIGSTHALGNPIGLLSNLGTGVFDLVNEPISGAIKGPAAFGRGVARGLGSFVKYCMAFGTEILTSKGEVIKVEELLNKARKYQLVNPDGEPIDIFDIEGGHSELMYTVRALTNPHKHKQDAPPNFNFTTHHVTPNHLVSHLESCEIGGEIHMYRVDTSAQELASYGGDQMRSRKLYKPIIPICLPHTGSSSLGWIHDCVVVALQQQQQQPAEEKGALEDIAWWIGVWVGAGDENMNVESISMPKFQDIKLKWGASTLSSLFTALFLSPSNKSTFFSASCLSCFILEPLSIRRALLSGLMDGCGRVESVNKQWYEIVLPDRKLEKDEVDRCVRFIRMLGLSPLAPYRSEDDKMIVPFNHPLTSVLRDSLSHMTSPSTLSLFTRADILTETTLFESPFVVTPSPPSVSRRYVKFLVPGGRFLLGDLTVTHNSVYGVANTASSLIGTLGNASATLSADPDYLRRRKMGRLRQPKHIASGLAEGTRHLAKGVFDGITGIISKPVEGAMYGGALGFVKGVGRGLIGVVVKPVTGVFDAVTTFTDGIKNTTTMFDKRVGTQRPPRIMYGADQIMRIYSDKELAASCFLDTQGRLRIERHQLETYQDHFTLRLTPSKAMILDNEAHIKHALSVSSLNELNTIRDGEYSVSSSAAPSANNSPLSTPRMSPSSAQLDDFMLDSEIDLNNSLAPTEIALRAKEHQPQTPSPPVPVTPSHARGSSMTLPSSRAVSISASTPSSSSSSPSQQSWPISLVLTDHSLVCVKLDIEGNLRASTTQSNARVSSVGPSSAQASAQQQQLQQGGHISTMLSAPTSPSSAAAQVSKFARLLWSVLWINIESIERGEGDSEIDRDVVVPVLSASSSSSASKYQLPKPQPGCSLTIRLLVNSRQLKSIRKSDKVRSLFPLRVQPLSQQEIKERSEGNQGRIRTSNILPPSFFSTSSSATASSTSITTSASSSTAAAQPLILLSLTLRTASSAECDRLESLLRMSHNRARAEREDFTTANHRATADGRSRKASFSGRGNEGGSSNTTVVTRAEVQQQLER